MLYESGGWVDRVRGDIALLGFVCSRQWYEDETAS